MSQDDSSTVTLTALVSNVDDDYTLTWDTDSLSNPSINDNAISFDASSMASGSYTVSVTLTSDSDSTLILTDDYSFTVDKSGGTSSGGSMGLSFMMFLSLIYLFKRKKMNNSHCND